MKHRAQNQQYQPRIALVVDNPLRDLPGMVLTAWKLAQSGALVFLVPMNLQREMWALAPDFILLNYLRANNERPIRKFIAGGFRIGVLDTEGGVFNTLPETDASEMEGHQAGAYEEYALTMTSDVTLRRQVSCFCAWTEEFAEYAVKAGWYLPEQISVTGTPRSDFY